MVSNLFKQRVAWQGDSFAGAGALGGHGGFDCIVTGSSGDKAIERIAVKNEFRVNGFTIRAGNVPSALVADILQIFHGALLGIGRSDGRGHQSRAFGVDAGNVFGRIAVRMAVLSMHLRVIRNLHGGHDLPHAGVEEILGRRGGHRRCEHHGSDGNERTDRGQDGVHRIFERENHASLAIVSLDLRQDFLGQSLQCIIGVCFAEVRDDDVDIS